MRKCLTCSICYIWTDLFSTYGDELETHTLFCYRESYYFFYRKQYYFIQGMQSFLFQRTVLFFYREQHSFLWGQLHRLWSFFCIFQHLFLMFCFFTKPGDHKSSCLFFGILCQMNENSIIARKQESNGYNKFNKTSGAAVISAVNKHYEPPSFHQILT